MGESGIIHNFHLNSQEIDFSGIIEQWSTQKSKEEEKTSRLFHLDITLAKDIGKNDLLFSLSILKGLLDDKGNIWICSLYDMYLLEMTSATENLNNVKESLKNESFDEIPFYQLLPTVECRSPKQVLDIMHEQECTGKEIVKDPKTGMLIHLMNLKLFKNNVIQRPYHYLSLYDKKSKELESFSYQGKPSKDYSSIPDCIMIFLK